jgi:hypothetical protein
MVEIKNVKVYGLHESMKRSGYPMQTGEPEIDLYLNDSDIARATKLSNTPQGSGHSNFLKGIVVQLDIKYPQYFTPQLQRYHWIDIISSNSKMHRLVTKASQDDFHTSFNKYVDNDMIARIKEYVDKYNTEDDKYFYFMKALSNLPMGYELWMGISTNYLQLTTIYNQRKNHRLTEDWGAFCTMIENLPYSYFITGENNDSKSV